MEEPTFEDEEIIFIFEGKEYSVMVDFYAQDDWRILDIAVWNDEKDEWSKPLINLHMQKKLTKAMNREIEEMFESYREEARAIIKESRKTHRKDIAKISLGLTAEQLEDFVITEFMMDDIKLLMGPDLEERKGKWDGDDTNI